MYLRSPTATVGRLYFISLPYLASTVFTIDVFVCLGGFRGEGFCYGVRDFGFGLGSIKKPGDYHLL